MINVKHTIARFAVQFAALTLSEPALLADLRLCPGCEVRVERCQCDEHMKTIKLRSVT